MSENEISINSQNDSSGNLIIHIPNFLQDSCNFITSSENQKDDISHLFNISFFSHDGQQRLYVDNPNALKDVLIKYCIFKKLAVKAETTMGIKIINEMAKSVNGITETENMEELDNNKSIKSSDVSIIKSNEFIEQENIGETIKTDIDINPNKAKRVTIENYPPMKTFETKYELRNNLFAIEEAECEEPSQISSEKLQPSNSLLKRSIDESTETLSFIETKHGSATNLVTLVDKHELSSKLSTEEELQSLVSFLRMSVDEFYPEDLSSVKVFSTFTQVLSAEEELKNTDTVSTQASIRKETDRNDAGTVTDKQKRNNCILS